MKTPKRPAPNVTQAQKEPSEEQRAAQQSAQLTAAGVILMAILVINIIFWVNLSCKCGGNTRKALLDSLTQQAAQQTLAPDAVPAENTAQ